MSSPDDPQSEGEAQSPETKYEASWLSWVFYINGIGFFCAALGLLVVCIIQYADNSRAEPELLGVALGCVLMGLVYLAIGGAVHQVLDFLCRSAVANEAMLELLERQNRMLAARENAPAVRPPVVMTPATIAITTPPVKQAADELKPAPVVQPPVDMSPTSIALTAPPVQSSLLIFQPKQRNPATNAITTPPVKPAANELESAPVVQPPVASFCTIIEPDTPPVKQAADELETTCGHCSTQILFPREGVGQKVPCPVCGNAVLLAAN